MNHALRNASLTLLAFSTLALAACASNDTMDDAPAAESAPAETMGEPAPATDPSAPPPADATPPTEAPPPPPPAGTP